MMTFRRAVSVLLLLSACLTQAGCRSLFKGSDKEPGPLTLVEAPIEFKLDEPGDVWTFRTPELWRVAVEGDRRFLQMAPPPERPMLPGVRRPQEYAIYNKYQFRNFSLSCRVRVDCDPAVAGRDACIIFGRQDETHFYYVHLSNAASGSHNTIVRVDGDTRTTLLPAGQHPPVTVPGREWHKVDVLRDVDAGTITLYVDAYDPGRATPWAQVRDTTYDWGHIGLGSFNDHASFGRILLAGEARRSGPSPGTGPPALPAE